ncbi:glutathione peroxidase [uncultured Algibacter sp.]|uniref:glutathione peroxidase n=1 Tax=uncultured Algibacter sp. TaxID=298659 RepID=UPI002618DEFB|nr:glutathione peroxidase [uncultured Algibacter sp.]
MNTVKAFFATVGTIEQDLEKINADSIYDIEIKTLSNKPIDLSQFRGKYILLVNVASKCGFTPQYTQLQELHEKYKSQLQVIGVPCNQFGSQEPENAGTIDSFCKINYGVSFLITEKIDVKGKNQHPLYVWLTQRSKNRVKSSSVKWNFQKYLIDKQGHLIDYYFSTTNPLNPKITKHLK